MSLVWEPNLTLSTSLFFSFIKKIIFIKKLFFSKNLKNYFLGDMQSLQNVVLIVNSFTECPSFAVQPGIWQSARTRNPNLKVHLVMEGTKNILKDFNFQDGAPVKSIIYNNSYAEVTISK